MVAEARPNLFGGNHSGRCEENAQTYVARAEPQAPFLRGVSDPNFLWWNGQAVGERDTADVRLWFLAEQIEDSRDDIERTCGATVA